MKKIYLTLVLLLTVMSGMQAKDYDIIVQYDDRYTIRLGGTDDLAYKIQYLTSILAELSDFQAGTIDLTDAANKKATFQPAG